MMPPSLQPQDLFLYSTLWGFMRLASRFAAKISQVWQQLGCAQGLGKSERRNEKACSIPGHTPATCSSCLPPLLQRAGPPIGLSHIRLWLPAKPHNPQRHKSSTACLNKRAVVAAVPGGCGAGMGAFHQDVCVFRLQNKPVFTSMHYTRKERPFATCALDGRACSGIINQLDPQGAAHPRAYPHPSHRAESAVLNSQ